MDSIAVLVNDRATREVLRDTADLWAGDHDDIYSTYGDTDAAIPDHAGLVVVDWDNGESEGRITGTLLFRNPRPRIVILTAPSDREPLDAEDRPLATLRQLHGDTVATVEKPVILADLARAVAG